MTRGVKSRQKQLWHSGFWLHTRLFVRSLSILAPSLLFSLLCHKSPTVSKNSNRAALFTSQSKLEGFASQSNAVLHVLFMDMVCLFCPLTINNTVACVREQPVSSSLFNYLAKRQHWFKRSGGHAVGVNHVSTRLKPSRHIGHALLFILLKLI